MRFGDLKLADGGSIHVRSGRLRNTKIVACLLLPNGREFSAGCLRISDDKVIDGAGTKLRDWFAECSRGWADSDGSPDDAIPVFAELTDDGAYGLRLAEPPVARAARLADLIGTDFYENRLDLSRRTAKLPDGAWNAMPEVEAVDQIKAEGASEEAVRIFLTLVAAMDRNRDAGQLWRAGVALFRKHREVFYPAKVAKLDFETLQSQLREFRVSRYHKPDAEGWQRIATSLVNDVGPKVNKAIRDGSGDAVELLREVRKKGRFPLLQGPKIAPMWVRMLAEPGGADIARIREIPVAVDRQVIRVTANLGVASGRNPASEADKEAVRSAWRRAVRGGDWGPSRIAGTCAALDPALWIVGKYGCSHCEDVRRRVPICRACDDCRLPE